MLSSRWRALSYVMFGLSLCVCVLLASPSTARADVLDINLEWDELRLYESPDVTSSDALVSDVQSLSTYKDFEPEVYNYQSNDEFRFMSGYFPAYSSTYANSLIGLWIPLGSNVIPQGYKLRLVIPHTSWSVNTDTSSTFTPISMTVQSVWVGTGIGTLQKCTYSGGGYVAPTSGRGVLVLFNSTGRSAGVLSAGHRYLLEGIPKLYLEIPDPTATQINDQSVTNTENLIDSQEQQTDTLMDTSGSSDLMTTENMDTYRRFYDQLGPVGQLNEVYNQVKGAVNTTQAIDVVTFPGISLMGFVIPSQSVTISDKMLGLVERIRWITTFCFVAMFVRYLRAFVAAVFGTEEIGLWVSRDEDVERQEDNMRGFTALGRYYNTDVHHHGKILR